MMVSEAATVEKLKYVNYMMHGFVSSSHARLEKVPMEYGVNCLRQRNWQSPVSTVSLVNTKSTRLNEKNEQICISPGMSPNPQEKDEMKWNSDNNSTCSEHESRCNPKSDGYTSSITNVSVINDGNSPGYEYMTISKTYLEHNMNNSNLKRNNNIHRSIQVTTMPATHTYAYALKTYNTNVSIADGTLPNTFSNRYCASNPPVHLGYQHCITIVIVPQNPVPENVKEINAGLCWDFD